VDSKKDIKETGKSRKKRGEIPRSRSPQSAKIQKGGVFMQKRAPSLKVTGRENKGLPGKFGKTWLEVSVA